MQSHARTRTCPQPLSFVRTHTDCVRSYSYSGTATVAILNPIAPQPRAAAAIPRALAAVSKRWQRTHNVFRLGHSTAAGSAASSVLDASLRATVRPFERSRPIANARRPAPAAAAAAARQDTAGRD